jgi:hypothetical protein
MKRGGDVSALDLDEALAAAKEPNTDLAAIDDALTALGAVDARKGQVVEMRFFGGMRVEESAEVLKISSETVRRDWKLAKRWLRREMSGSTHVDSERWRKIENSYHAALEQEESCKKDASAGGPRLVAPFSASTLRSSIISTTKQMPSSPR